MTLSVQETWEWECKAALWLRHHSNKKTNQCILKTACRSFTRLLAEGKRLHTSFKLYTWIWSMWSCLQKFKLSKWRKFQLSNMWLQGFFCELSICVWSKVVEQGIACLLRHHFLISLEGLLDLTPNPVPLISQELELSVCVCEMKVEIPDSNSMSEISSNILCEDDKWTTHPINIHLSWLATHTDSGPQTLTRFIHFPQWTVTASSRTPSFPSSTSMYTFPEAAACILELSHSLAQSRQCVSWARLPVYCTFSWWVMFSLSDFPVMSISLQNKTCEVASNAKAERTTKSDTQIKTETKWAILLLHAFIPSLAQTDHKRHFGKVVKNVR